MLLPFHEHPYLPFHFLQCRNCDYSQPAGDNCVYVNKITHEVEWVYHYISSSHSFVMCLSHAASLRKLWPTSPRTQPSRELRTILAQCQWWRRNHHLSLLCFYFVFFNLSVGVVIVMQFSFRVNLKKRRLVLIFVIKFSSSLMKWRVHLRNPRLF